MVERSVLSFVDVPLPGHDDANSRQLAIDGQLLQARIDDAIGHEAGQSTLIVDGLIAFPSQQRYLEGLRGGSNEVGLPSGTIALGYCDKCFDNDGWVLATRIEIAVETVVWRSTGFAIENGIPMVRKRWRWVAGDAPPGHEWWLLEPFTPEWTVEFDRSQYEDAIDAEIQRSARMAAQ